MMHNTLTLISALLVFGTTAIIANPPTSQAKTFKKAKTSASPSSLSTDIQGDDRGSSTPSPSGQPSGNGEGTPKPDSSSTTPEKTDGEKASESTASGDKPAGESTPSGETADAGDKVTPEEKSQPENKPQDVYVMGSPNRNVYSQPESWETTGPSDGEYRPHFRSGGMNIENIEMTDADKMPITVGVGPIVMEEGAKAKEVLAEKEQRFMVGVLSDIAELPVSDVLKSEVEVVSGGVKTSRLKGSEAEAKVTALLEQAENELSNKLLVLETQKSALMGDIATLEKKASANAEAQIDNDIRLRSQDSNANLYFGFDVSSGAASEKNSVGGANATGSFVQDELAAALGKQKPVTFAESVVKKVGALFEKLHTIDTQEKFLKALKEKKLALTQASANRGLASSEGATSRTLGAVAPKAAAFVSSNKFITGTIWLLSLSSVVGFFGFLAFRRKKLK